MPSLQRQVARPRRRLAFAILAVLCGLGAGAFAGDRVRDACAARKRAHAIEQRARALKAEARQASEKARRAILQLERDMAAQRRRLLLNPQLQPTRTPILLASEPKPSPSR